MADFTPQQKEEFKEAFHLFDKDGDGKIGTDEIGTVMRAIGKNPTQAEIKELSKGVSGGKVDFNQFLALLQKRGKIIEGDSQVKEAFKVFDSKSGSGLVEISELRHILTTLGEKLSPEEVDGVLKEADSDSDGKISLDDFLRVMNSAKV